jgi:hypothetical protein
MDFHEASPSTSKSVTSYIAAISKQHLSTLQDTTVSPRVYVFIDKKHDKPIFFSKVVQLPGPPDMEEGDLKLLLAHGSNNPSSVHPELPPSMSPRWLSCWTH